MFQAIIFHISSYSLLVNFKKEMSKTERCQMSGTFTNAKPKQRTVSPVRGVRGHIARGLKGTVVSMEMIASYTFLRTRHANKCIKNV